MTLFLVATPIGNLGDITARALETLRSANVIAAEDTRVTRKLVSHYRIATPLISYHEHSGPAATDALVRRMSERGETVALVTDAGTPGISDPGVDLVTAAISQGVSVVPIPGPSAVICAVAASGLPSARFVFEGFLPRTRSTRLKKLAELSAEPRTVVFYESPHRIAETLAEIASAFGAERPACVAREITKKFEEFRRGSAGALAALYAGEKTRGECVIVVAGAPEGSGHRDNLSAMRQLENPPERATDLIKLLAAESGVPRRELYRIIVELKAAKR